jgi:hypothetical protein
MEGTSGDLSDSMGNTTRRLTDAQIVEELVDKYTCLHQPEQLEQWLQKVINEDYRQDSDKESIRKTKRFYGSTVSYLTNAEVFNILTPNNCEADEYSITLRPFLYLYFSSNNIKELKSRFLLVETDFKFMVKDITRTILHLTLPPEHIPVHYKP